MKSAISMDGKTALSTSESKWITSTSARKDVQKLRAKSCAVLTGIETVIADDPSLTVRLSNEELGGISHFEQPLRVIVDTNLRIPEDAKVLNNPGKAIIYTCSDNAEKMAVLNDNNTECVIASLKNDRVDLNEVMLDLAQRGINEILVEAGSTLVGSLLEENRVDEIILYMAPHLLGDAGRGVAQLSSVKTMKDRIELEILETSIVGDNIKMKAKPLLK